MHDLFGNPEVEMPGFVAGYRVLDVPMTLFDENEVISRYDPKETIDFFKNLNPISIPPYARICEIAQNPPTDAYNPLGLIGFDPSAYALYLAQGVAIADPEGRYSEARKPIQNLLEMLQSWTLIVGKHERPPHLVELAEEGMDDASEVFWAVAYPNNPLFGNVASDLEFIQDALLYATDPKAQNEHLEFFRP